MPITSTNQNVDNKQIEYKIGKHKFKAAWKRHGSNRSSQMVTILIQMLIRVTMLGLKQDT